MPGCCETSGDAARPNPVLESLLQGFEILKMPKCVVFGCDRTTGRHLLEDDGCTPLNFFSLAGIPHNTLRTWLKLCKRSDIPFEKCKHARICSRHFMPGDILGNRMVKARLRIGAFPARHLPISKFATSFRETSQAQLSAASTKVKNIICEEKPEDFILGTLQPPVCTHPVPDATKLDPPWYFNTVGDVTWYFLVTVTDNSDNTFPEVEKSVRISNDGSTRPQFYIGKEMLSEFRAKAVMRYKNFKIEEHFIRILEDFSKLPPAETSLLDSVLDMLNSVLDDNENENATAVQDIVREEPENNSEGAVDVQHVGHEESVTCDNSEESESQEQDVDHKESDCAESESGEMNTVGLRFMMEQLQLYAVPPRNRRWNSSLMKWAMAMHANSPAAYRYMRSSGYLYLPCERTLSRYTTFGTLKPWAAKKRKGSELIKEQNETHVIHI